MIAGAATTTALYGTVTLMGLSINTPYAHRSWRVQGFVAGSICTVLGAVMSGVAGSDGFVTTCEIDSSKCESGDRISLLETTEGQWFVAMAAIDLLVGATDIVLASVQKERPKQAHGVRVGLPMPTLLPTPGGAMAPGLGLTVMGF